MSAKQGQSTEVESSGSFLFLKKETNNENTHVLIYFMGAEYLPSAEILIPPEVAFKKMPAVKRAIYDGHLRFKVWMIFSLAIMAIYTILLRPSLLLLKTVA